MNYLVNPQQVAAAQQQALQKLPQALQLLDSHTGDIIALRTVIAAIAATLADNETFKSELERQLSAALPHPGQLVPFNQKPMVDRAKKTLREVLPPNLSTLVRD